MSHIASPSRVPDASRLDYDAYIAGLARVLEKVVKLADPHMRRVALTRAKIFDYLPRDEHLAVERVLLKRRALAGSIEGLAA